MFKNKSFFKYVSALIVCIFVVLVAVQSGKSFVLDEIDFPTVSHATSESGKPVYYRGEETQQHIGTYHPTLYINSLAAFIKVFGFNETSIRLFGAICVLISALLLILIYRQLTKKNEGLETLFLGLYLLNPYTIANATLPDIDLTILPLLLLLFIYVALKYLLQKRLMTDKVVLILASLFAITLWSKLTTPLIIPPLLACLAIITTKNVRKSILFTIKVTLAGFVLFASTYFLYCILLGLSPTYTYGFLVDSFTKGTSSDGPLVGVINNLGNLRHFVYWPTLPVVGITGVALIGVLLDKGGDDKTKIKKLVLVMSVLVTLFYIALISPFGGYFKYPFPVFGLLLLSIIFFYEQHLRTLKINVPYAIVAVLLGFLVEKTFWKDSMFLSTRPFDYLWVLLLCVLVTYALMTHAKTRNIAKGLFILAIFFSIGFQLSISRVQAIAPYPTKYLYGQTGLDEAAAYLRVNTKSDEAIWSMKDIGYYVNNKYRESYPYYFDKSLEKDLVDMLRGGDVRYYVVTNGIGQDNIDYYTDIKQILEKYAIREKQFGNYVIYKVKE